MFTFGLTEYPLKELLYKVQRNAHWILGFYLTVFLISLISGVYSYFIEDNFILWIISFCGFLLLPVAIYLLYGYLKNINDPYSMFRMVERNPDQLTFWDIEMERSEKLGDRLGITKAYLFSLKSSFYIPIVIPTDQIVWAYFKHFRRRGKKVHSVDLYIVTKDNQTYKLPLGGKLLWNSAESPRFVPLDKWVLDRIKAWCPHILIGDLPEYFEMRKKNFEEMKNQSMTKKRGGAG